METQDTLLLIIYCKETQHASAVKNVVKSHHWIKFPAVIRNQLNQIRDNITKPPLSVMMIKGELSRSKCWKMKITSRKSKL